MEVEAVEIELERGQSGLGFSIRGGIDIPHLPEDHGIFIARIMESGAAGQDGRLREGDKILEINGHSLDTVTHNEAVAHFRNFETVKLKVLPGEEQRIVERRLTMAEQQGPVEPSGVNVVRLSIGVVSVAVALSAVYIAYRHFKSKS